MKNHFFHITLILLFSANVSHAQSEKKSFTSDKYNSKYELKNGMLDGSYVSWYKNGTKKAEGTFAHNERTGNWKVWDSTGKLRAERDYKNGYEYKRILPVIPDGPAKLFERFPKYTLQRDSSGIFLWCYLQERSVFYAKRIWRFLDFSGNKNNINLYAVFQIIQALGAEEIITFYENEELQKALKKIPYYKEGEFEFLGFKLKEDWFYDSDRMISESRTLCLCPVIRLKDKPDETINTYWIYYPEIRKYFATFQPDPLNNSTYINMVDDIFFFHYYNSTIYKESNVYDREIDSKDIPSETQHITFDLIETEHDIWLFFS